MTKKQEKHQSRMEKKEQTRQVRDKYNHWITIQNPSSGMQFKDLKRIKSGQEYYFEKDKPASCVMKYNVMDNPYTLKNDFPQLHLLFEKNNDLCSRYLSYTSEIDCIYKSVGRNILANKKGVPEQYMHSDYSASGFD